MANYLSLVMGFLTIEFSICLNTRGRSARNQVKFVKSWLACIQSLVSVFLRTLLVRVSGKISFARSKGFLFGLIRGDIEPSIIR